MEVYAGVMGPRMFTPWAELLLDELAPVAGETVLDVACGPGSVARPAAARVGASGRVVGCDLSPAMLEVARAQPPAPGAAGIEYHEAPADRLPVEDASFDVGTCQQGFQFFPDRPAAAAELRRALRPGGRLGVAVWVEIAGCPPFRAVADAVETVLGTELADRYRGGPWGFPDPDRLGGLLNDAGFDDVQVLRRRLPVTFEGGAEQLVSTIVATPLADAVDALDDAGRERLVAEVATTLGGGPIASHLTSNVALARRS